MKRIKKAFALLMVLLMLMSAMPAVYAASEEGLVPIRQFFESLGGGVDWDENERSIIVDLQAGTLVFFPNQTTAIINGNEVELENAVRIVQGISYIAEADLEFAILTFQTTIPLTTFYLTEEARDIALEDFDYMVNFILENSVWDNILYRRLGIDFEEHAAAHRHLIEEMVALDLPVMQDYYPIRDGDDPRSLAANYLISLITFSFSLPFDGIGHLVPRDAVLYESLISSYAQILHENPDNQFFQFMQDTYTHPSAVWFYGEHEADLEAEVLLPQIIGNVTAEIIVPDEVAYLSIASFLTDMAFDDLVILPFLREIRDFDHLIIDLRGNGGGIATYFNELILFRLLNEPAETLEFEFFTSGEAAMDLMELMLLYTVEAYETEEYTMFGRELISSEIIPAHDFIQQQRMTAFNPNDAERLTNVFVTRASITPDLMTIDDRIAFDGRVWLLIDEYSASASSLAALMSMMTGFATVVGENSSGTMGSSHMYIVLPNTGILWRTDIGHVTDSDGRSLEEFGIAPDIRNLPGMDALETVLAIIAEEVN